jgi:hypothetical protein
VCSNPREGGTEKIENGFSGASGCTLFQFVREHACLPAAGDKETSNRVVIYGDKQVITFSPIPT